MDFGDFRVDQVSDQRRWGVMRLWVSTVLTWGPWSVLHHRLFSLFSSSIRFEKLEIICCGKLEKLFEEDGVLGQNVFPFSTIERFVPFGN